MLNYSHGIKVMAILVLRAIRAKLKAGLKTKPGGSHENLIDLSHNSQFFGFFNRSLRHSYSVLLAKGE